MVQPSFLTCTPASCPPAYLTSPLNISATSQAEPAPKPIDSLRLLCTPTWEPLPQEKYSHPPRATKSQSPAWFPTLPFSLILNSSLGFVSFSSQSLLEPPTSPSSTATIQPTLCGQDYCSCLQMVFWNVNCPSIYPAVGGLLFLMKYYDNTPCLKYHSYLSVKTKFFIVFYKTLAYLLSSMLFLSVPDTDYTLSCLRYFAHTVVFAWTPPVLSPVCL